MKVGETYTGEELLELCGAGDNDNRFYAVVGKKASVIIEDVGNDNYKIIEIVKQTE